MKNLIVFIWAALCAVAIHGPANADSERLFEKYGLRFAYEGGVKLYKDRSRPEYDLGFYYVEDVKPGSHAEAAGIKPGFLIDSGDNSFNPVVSAKDADVEAYNAEFFALVDDLKVTEFYVYGYDKARAHVEKKGGRFNMSYDAAYHFPVRRLENHLGFEIDEKFVVTRVVAGSSADVAQLKVGDKLGKVEVGPHGSNAKGVMEQIFFGSRKLSEGDYALLTIVRGDDVVELKFPIRKFSEDSPVPQPLPRETADHPANPFLSAKFRSRNFDYRATDMLPMIYDGDLENLIEDYRRRNLTDAHMSGTVFGFLHGIAREIHKDNELLRSCYPEGHMRLPWTEHVEYKNMTYGYTTYEYTTRFLEVFAPQMEAYYRAFFEFWHQPAFNTPFSAGRVLIDEHGCGPETRRMIEQVAVFADRVLQDH